MRVLYLAAIGIPIMLASCATAEQQAAERAELEQLVRYSAMECAQSGYQPGTVEHSDCASMLAKRYDRMLNSAPDHSAALGMMMLGTTMMQAGQPRVVAPAPPPSPLIRCWNTPPDLSGNVSTFCQ